MNRADKKNGQHRQRLPANDAVIAVVKKWVVSLLQISVCMVVRRLLIADKNTYLINEGRPCSLIAKAMSCAIES